MSKAMSDAQYKWIFSHIQECVSQWDKALSECTTEETITATWETIVSEGHALTKKGRDNDLLIKVVIASLDYLEAKYDKKATS